MPLRKKKDDDASRAFWTLAEKTALEVAAWPAWKRAEKAAAPPRSEAKKTVKPAR